MKWVKRYKFPAIKLISYEEILWSMVTIVYNTVWHI